MISSKLTSTGDPALFAPYPVNALATFSQGWSQNVALAQNPTEAFPKRNIGIAFEKMK